jgi:hypothetical protein
MMLGRLGADKGLTNGSMKAGYFAGSDDGLPATFVGKASSLVANERVAKKVEGRLRLEYQAEVKGIEADASQARKKASEMEHKMKEMQQQLQVQQQVQQQMQQQLQAERAKHAAQAQGATFAVGVPVQSQPAPLRGKMERPCHRFSYSARAVENGEAVEAESLLPIKLLEFETPAEKLLQQFETPILEHEIELHQTGDWSVAALRALLGRLRSNFDERIAQQISSLEKIQQLAEVAVLGLSHLSHTYLPVMEMIRAQEKVGMQSLLDIMPGLQTAISHHTSRSTIVTQQTNDPCQLYKEATRLRHIYNDIFFLVLEKAKGGGTLGGPNMSSAEAAEEETVSDAIDRIRVTAEGRDRGDGFLAELECIAGTIEHDLEHGKHMALLHAREAKEAASKGGGKGKGDGGKGGQSRVETIRAKMVDSERMQQEVESAAKGARAAGLMGAEDRRGSGGKGVGVKQKSRMPRRSSYAWLLKTQQKYEGRPGGKRRIPAHTSWGIVEHCMGYCRALHGVL